MCTLIWRRTLSETNDMLAVTGILRLARVCPRRTFVAS